MERLLTPELEKRIEALPTNPGVYLMKDSNGVVIYVGKAVNLKNRVRQYFGSLSNKENKVAAMVRHIATFETIVVNSEMEALILECNLIKQYRPHYNILLMDDKQFPYVRIQIKEDYPRITIVRKVENDGAKYYGPYLSAHSIREVMDVLYKLFPIRSCKKELNGEFKKSARPCLNYQMGRCSAPCCGFISKEEYAKMISEVMGFLSGKTNELRHHLTEEMKAESERMNFERAAVLRDKLRELDAISERQRAGFPNLHDKDILAAAVGKDRAVVQAFFIRGGKLSETTKFTITGAENEKDALENFIKQYYLSKNLIPANIYISTPLSEDGLTGELLSSIRGSKVKITVPQKGDNKQLVLMAQKNAQDSLKNHDEYEQRTYRRTIGAAEKLGKRLGIGTIHRLECYDISNTQGTDSVASMVVFSDGKPDKKEYRRFRIKTVKGANDFASMAEVLTRRLIRGMEAQDKTHGFGCIPNLIIVDGGKGQLSSAVEALESVGMENIPIVGLAKREEEIFFPGESEPLRLPLNSDELRLVTGIRDEAHRFAITYHRSLREKRNTTSTLENIEGVGKTRAKILFDSFGDIDAIQKASIDELASVSGIDIRTARNVFNYFHD